MRFFKNGRDGGNGKFLLEMGGEARNGRIGFIMGGWEILNSLYIVGRGVLTPYFVKTPYFELLHIFISN